MNNEKKIWREMNDAELKIAVRTIINSSNSDEEIRKRIVDELKYEYSPDGICIASTGGKRMYMAMVMLWSKNGNSISV
jgi:hypothetical protein